MGLRLTSRFKPPSWLRASLAVALVLALTLPSHAGWREDMKTFRVGMIERQGAGQAVPGLSILERSYSMALGIPVEIFVARDYAALIDAQASGRVDYAIYSTTAYATAQLLCSCVEPVVAPVAEPSHVPPAATDVIAGSLDEVDETRSVVREERRA